MLEALRMGSESDAPAAVVKLLNLGKSPQAIWDAMLSAAGEMTMQKPGIITLHAVTTTNALRPVRPRSERDATAQRSAPILGAADSPANNAPVNSHTLRQPTRCGLEGPRSMRHGSKG